MNDTDLLTVGATLKNRREQLGLSLEDIAEKTCIRFAFLKAIEEDRFDGFPGNAYLQGFLKAFAETLGLEVQSIVEQFRQQTGIRVGDARESMPDAYDLPMMVFPRRNKPYRFLLLLVVGGLIGGLVYFTVHYWPFSGDLTFPKTELTPSPEAPVALAEPVVDSSPGGLPEFFDAPAPIDSVSYMVSREPSVSAGLPMSKPTIYSLPEEGGILRVEVVGSVNVTVRIDDLPIRGYALLKDTVLSWRVSRSMQLHVDTPGMLKVWLNKDLLEWSGHSELMLRSASQTVGEEEY